jgi:hypothetical protein
MNCESGGPTSSNEFRESLKAIKLTEINYHPLDSGDTNNGDLFEFVELKNTANSKIDMSDVGFSDGIDYTFPNGASIEPQSFYIIAADSDHFKSRYGFAPNDVYKGKLSNSGETIALTDLKSGGQIFSVTYSDTIPWPVEADGDGNSLVPVTVSTIGDQKSADQWRASTNKDGGSPGKDD